MSNFNSSVFLNYMTLSEDEYWMQKALEYAAEALTDTPREVPIAALFVKNGKLLAKSYNKTNALRCATRHAEMMCLDQLAKDHDLTDVTLYVTVEPCIMCASALIEHKVKKIVFGAINDKFGGVEGVINCYSISNKKLLDFEPEIIGGIFKEEAVKLLQDFYERGNISAPKPHRKIQ